MYGWNDRPTKASAKHFIGGDTPAAVYGIGKYEVTVPGLTPETDIEVTYRVPYHRSTDPRSALPNMEVSDGEIRIPVTDLVDEVLSRLDPVELAQAIWQNDDVKEAFMDCLVTRYNEQGIDDGDRRKFISRVKDAVHTKALDTLSSKMAALEYDMSKRSFFYHEVNDVNRRLHDAGVVDASGEPIRLRHEDNDPDFRIAGKHWNDARDYWRDEVLRQFPLPVLETV